MNEVKKDFGVCITKWVAYKIRKVVAKLLHDSMKEHYFKLGSYIEELKRSYSSSTFLLETDPPITEEIPVFKRLFVCFDGLRSRNVSGCRHVLCIDVAFLKTFLGGGGDTFVCNRY